MAVRHTHTHTHTHTKFTSNIGCKREKVQCLSYQRHPPTLLQCFQINVSCGVLIQYIVLFHSLCTLKYEDSQAEVYLNTQSVPRSKHTPSRL